VVAGSDRLVLRQGSGRFWRAAACERCGAEFAEIDLNAHRPTCQRSRAATARARKPVDHAPPSRQRRSRVLRGDGFTGVCTVCGAELPSAELDVHQRTCRRSRRRSGSGFRSSSAAPRARNVMSGSRQRARGGQTRSRLDRPSGRSHNPTGSRSGRFFAPKGAFATKRRRQLSDLWLALFILAVIVAVGVAFLVLLNFLAGLDEFAHALSRPHALSWLYRAELVLRS